MRQFRKYAGNRASNNRRNSVQRLDSRIVHSLEGSKNIVVSQNKYFNPRQKFLPIIEKLHKEGRMPSLEEYLAAVEKVRPWYRKEMKKLNRSGRPPQKY